MVRCPHCRNRSISPLRKILSSRYRPVECPSCGGLSATRVVAHYQFGLAVLYLAIFPNLLSEATLTIADIAVLALIFAIKLTAPMSRSPPVS